MFKKRKNRVFSASRPCCVPELVENDSGRSIVPSDVSSYEKNHPICMEEYTLTQQLQSGVPIQEIPCQHTLDDNSFHTSVEDSALLAKLQSDVKPENVNP